MYGVYASDQGSTDESLRSTRTNLYPNQAWYCIGLFIFVIAVFQWTSFFHSKFPRKRQTSRNLDPEQAYLHRRQHSSWRYIPLGLVNAYRVIAFRWTLEIGKSYSLTVAEVLITIGYIMFLFIWAFINTTDLEGHMFDLTYWCTRAGTLAASQFPLITALGTKNNIISLITGISYDKLNYVHRMMSRVVFVLLWFHIGSEVVVNAPFQPYLQQPWLICGIIAIIALAILCVVSLRPVRAQAYEFFFYVHFAMVLIFLICAYFHTQYDTVTYWIYPCFIIWGLDRIMRAVRLIVFNLGLESEYATTELLSDDFVRLRFHRPHHFHWMPGQAAYLIIPSVSRLPFEAHPFTIASSDSDLFNVLEEDKPQEVVFYINVRKGFTSKLKEAALKGEKVKVFIDGPYGSSPNMDSYDTSVLIAGGSGISYTLPVFLDIIERVRKDKSNCRRIVFIWSIRNVDHIRWIDEVLIRALQLAPPSLSITIRIHITGPRASIQESPRPCSQNDDIQAVCDDSRPETVEFVDAKEMEKGSNSLLAIEAVKLVNERCNLPSVLKDEVELASGRMSVSVCGSEGIVRSARSALRFPVSSPFSVVNGGPSVTIHIESFGYA